MTVQCSVCQFFSVTFFNLCPNTGFSDMIWIWIAVNLDNIGLVVPLTINSWYVVPEKNYQEKGKLSPKKLFFWGGAFGNTSQKKIDFFWALPKLPQTPGPSDPRPPSPKPQAFGRAGLIDFSFHARWPL